MRLDTVKHLSQWLWEVRQHSHLNMTIMLIRDKSDLKYRGAVSTKERKTSADKHRLNCLKTNTKTTHNVEVVLFGTVEKIHRNIESGTINVTNKS
jgi:hypothetical protein